jgi:hypothetical protein
VRAALVWLGEIDPCATRDSIRDDDPVTSSLATLVAAWVSCLGTGEVKPNSDEGWFTTGRICLAANETDLRDRALLRPMLNNALTAIMPKNVTPDGLGRYLSRFKDRIVGGHRLRKRQHPDTRQAEYLIEIVQSATKSEGKRTQGGFAFVSDEAASEGV